MLPESFGGRIIYLLQQYGPSFAKGAGVSMWLALVGTLFGCIIGFLVGIVQTIPIDRNDSTAKKILVKIVKFILACYITSTARGSSRPAASWLPPMIPSRRLPIGMALMI